MADEQENIFATPKTVNALIRGAKGDSSVVKYKITATPGYVNTVFFEPFQVLSDLI